jgi:hypothetical protein
MQADLHPPAVGITDEHQKKVEALPPLAEAAVAPGHDPVAGPRPSPTPSASARAKPSVSSIHRRSKASADSVPGRRPTVRTGSALAEAEPSGRVELPMLITPQFVNPSHSVKAAPSKPVPRLVSVGDDGQLSGGITGFVWVARGDGTRLSKPATIEEHACLACEEHAPLGREGGELCTRGTMMGLSCINETTSRMRCNWRQNWGVTIGFNVNADQNAWGESAAGGIAVRFHGRSAGYRLNAHRKGDPVEKNYCIDNYKSGQIVGPAMFKAPCWVDVGEALPDFKEVDYFDLQLQPGMDYRAFRYCISGIEIYP